MNICRKTVGLKVGALSVLLLALIVGVLPASADEDNRVVNWLTYREAMSAGEAQDKPILLHFTASYSALTRKMRRETYQDPQVIRYLNGNFAVAMVDIAQLPSLARKFKVESVPVLWFLDAAGKGLTSIEGEVGPAKMLRVTEYINLKIYEHTNYDTWLDKRTAR